MSILLYDDDILLVAPSVTALHKLLDICGLELEYIDMSINVSKSVCLRIGQDYCHECKCVCRSDGQCEGWPRGSRYYVLSRPLKLRVLLLCGKLKPKTFL